LIPARFGFTTYPSIHVSLFLAPLADREKHQS